MFLSYDFMNAHENVWLKHLVSHDESDDQKVEVNYCQQKPFGVHTRNLFSSDAMNEIGVALIKLLFFR
jgi:hypothetical protein